MSNMRSMVAAMFAFAVMASTCLAADKIDNPMYQQWAKYKPGTWVTVKTVSDSGGNKSEMVTTTKLVELTPDKAVVETAMKMKVAGNDMDMPAQKMDVMAKIDKPEGGPTGDAPKQDVKQGEDEVTAAGQKIKCKTSETTMKMGDANMTSKTWMSDDVPGSMVKMESKMDGANPSTTSMELVGMEVKK